MPDGIKGFFLNLKGLFTSDKTLKSRVFQGGAYLFFGTTVEQGLRFFRNIILARLLAPEAFGVMAVVLAVNNMVETFTDIGIRHAIVQNPRSEEESYLDAAWWLSFIRSLVLYMIVFALAPSIARFYGNPEFIPLIRTATLCLVFAGAMSTRAYIALKNLDMRRWVTVWNGGGAVGVLLTLLFSFFMKNVWALVFGLIAESFIRLLLSFVFTPHTPRWRYDPSSFRELITFSKGMFGLGFFSFIFSQSDIFFVGRLCTAYELGIYSMAISLSNLPVMMLTQFLDKVGMPALSAIQDDKDRLNHAMMKITYFLALAGFPLVAFIWVHGGAILSVVYGNAYAAAAMPFAIISLSMLLRMMSVPMAQVYFVTGRPGLHRNFTVLRAVIILSLFYPFIRWMGLTGAALSGLVAMGAGYGFQMFQLHKLTGYDWKRMVRMIGQSFGLAIVFWIIQVVVSNIVPSNNIINMIFGLFICFAYYIAFGIVLYLKEYKHEKLNNLQGKLINMISGR